MDQAFRLTAASAETLLWAIEDVRATGIGLVLSLTDPDGKEILLDVEPECADVLAPYEYATHDHKKMA